MIIDGSTSNSGNDKVWEQIITVVPNQNYTFSYWLETIATPNLALIDVTINGTIIGSTTAPATTCNWVQYTYTWNSGTNTMATIAIYDRLTIQNGNDFGLDDISFDGIELIEQIRLIYDNYEFDTQILAASVRHPMHIIKCAEAAADVMTGPLSAMLALLKHPLTDTGLAQFLADHAKANS